MAKNYVANAIDLSDFPSRCSFVSLCNRKLKLCLRSLSCTDSKSNYVGSIFCDKLISWFVPLLFHECEAWLPRKLESTWAFRSFRPCD